ncbi:MAG: VCBS repeat-containing protein [Phycisphaeraceae bacterium]|nr:VCBS repeat-containing protein [Phycisphaeraceae bacterium]
MSVPQRSGGSDSAEARAPGPRQPRGRDSDMGMATDGVNAPRAGAVRGALRHHPRGRSAGPRGSGEWGVVVMIAVMILIGALVAGGIVVIMNQVRERARATASAARAEQLAQELTLSLAAQEMTERFSEAMDELATKASGGRVATVEPVEPAEPVDPVTPFEPAESPRSGAAEAPARPIEPVTTTNALRQPPRVAQDEPVGACVPLAAAGVLIERGLGLMSQFEFSQAERIFSGALEALDRASTLDARLRAAPGCTEAVNHAKHVAALNRAIAILNQSEPGAQERAIGLLEELLMVPTDDVLALRAAYCLGLGHAYLGQPERALPFFELAAVAIPGDGAVLYQVAQAHEMLGDRATALDRYLQASRLDPFQRSALLGAQRLLARDGRDEEADAALKAFLELEDNPRSRLTEFKYTRMGPLSEAIPLDGDRRRPDPESGPPTASGDLARERAAIEALLLAIAPEFGTLLPEAGAALAPRAQPALDLASVDGVAALGRGVPTAVDLDGDGVTDLFIAGARDGGRGSAILKGRADGTFVLVEDGLFASMAGAEFVAFGDVNLDGRLEALVVTGAESVLLRLTADGAAERIAEWPSAADAIWVDLDHDGDLDLVLALRDQPPIIAMNRGEKGFEMLEASSGFKPALSHAERVVAGDFTGDSLIDLLFCGPDGAEVWLNDRFWSWRRDSAFAPIERSRARRVASGERGSDGRALIALLREHTDGVEAVLFAPGAGSAQGAWAEVASLTLPGTIDESEIALTDLLGSGQSEVVVFTDTSVVLTEMEWGGAGALRQRLRVPTSAGSDRRIAALAPFTAPVIVEWGEATRRVHVPVALAPEGTPTGSFVAVDFRGRVDPSQSMRSNTHGIGTRWASRAGFRWGGGWVLPAGGGPGQGIMPTLIGIGKAAQIDALFMDWPDGVTQSEMALAPGRVHVISEAQRQISSCPVIFAWDGERFVFETDAIGVGGIGYLVGVQRLEDGRLKPIYAPSRPRESIRLHTALAVKDGVFELRLTEPMEEACYLDAARLHAWRVPEGWSLALDERMAIHGPEPSGEALFYRHSMTPSAAEGIEVSVDGRRWSAAEALRDIDRVAAEFGHAHARFLGRLEDIGSLTLHFPQAIDAHAGTPVLLIEGWVEYPYSQTSFAMWQEEATPKAVSIDALDPVSGAWVTLIEEVGFPAGMTRECLLPLSGKGIAPLPVGCVALRLRTSVELFIDHLRVAWIEPCPQAERIDLPLRSAEVAECGYPRKLDLPQKRPLYDYDDRRPLWDCRTQPGLYTAFGDCTPLLEGADGALAMFGPGEEIRLRFDAAPLASLSALSTGSSRSHDSPQPSGRSSAANGAASAGASEFDDLVIAHEEHGAEDALTLVFILELDGWCKDMDRYTRDGATLEPLPEPEGLDEAARVRRDALHQRWNTRLAGGR